jgi:hypothetical protein
MVEVCLKALELGYFEMQFAFQGLADENVWRRPAPGLLSIGELAGHVAYWEAVRLAGNHRDTEGCRITSPLVDLRFQYYTPSVQNPPSDEHQAMNAEQVYRELLRVHQEAVADFKSRNLDIDAELPGAPPGYNYRHVLEYLAFHIAYHVGQMYSVRHLLGEQPPDN